MGAKVPGGGQRARRHRPTTLGSLDGNQHRHTSAKYGHLTHILINTLVRSGDISTNPGPSSQRSSKCINRNNHGRKTKCKKCKSVTRYRRFHCLDCGDLGKLMCPYCLTDELVQHYSNNSEVREYKCNKCIVISINVSDVSTPPPIVRTEVVGRAGNKVSTTAAAATTTSTHTNGHKENICGHCIKPFKCGNKKHSCLNCHSTFHPKCYRSVNIGNNMCKICLLSELPLLIVK